jgi:hypothetical protein
MNETDTADRAAILAANTSYYRAFAAGDVAGMRRIWADDGVSCVHPGWPALIGRAAILESYDAILDGANRVRIVARDANAILSGPGNDEGRVLCVELVEGSALAATNCFRRIDGVWRMVHHQASPIAARAEDERPPSGRLN